MAYGTIPYSVNDARVYPYAAGVPGAAIDLVGIRRVELSPNFETVEHRGDNAVIASGASLGSIGLTIEVGALALAAIAATTGGVVTTTGVTPNQITTLTRKTTDVITPFALKAYAAANLASSTIVDLPYVEGGRGFPMSLADNEYPAPSIEATAIKNAADILYKVIQYETAATGASAMATY